MLFITFSFQKEYAIKYSFQFHNAEWVKGLSYAKVIEIR